MKIRLFYGFALSLWVPRFLLFNGICASIISIMLRRFGIYVSSLELHGTLKNIRKNLKSFKGITVLEVITKGGFELLVSL